MDALSTYRRLQRSTLAQTGTFVLLAFLGAVGTFELVALPLVRMIFHDSLGAQTQELNHWLEWLLVVDPAGGARRLYPDAEVKVYVFNPVLSLFPLVLAAGFVVATVVTALLPRSIGLMRKNLEREVSQALHILAQQQFGSAGAEEGVQLLRQRIAAASPEQLHALEAELNLSYDELRMLQRGVLWMMGARLRYLPAALRLYMRNHFTIEYEQAVLGTIYVGAAVLIIVIGLRGLQFIPKERPSLVLFAIALEFVLLIAYAITLIFSRPEEEKQTTDNSWGQLLAGANTAVSPLYSVEYAEKLLRMFIVLPPPRRESSAGDDSTPPQSH